jgi:hypothetical protein
MPYREQPMDLGAAPVRYPAPDWTEIGTWTRVWVPDDETVGWAIIQGDERIAWISGSDPESLGYVIRLQIDELLREGAKDGTPVPAAWAEILRRTLHTTPQQAYLPALLADIQAEWSPGG